MKLMPMILWMVVDIDDESANHSYNVASNVDRKITHMHLSITICVGTNIYCSSYYVSSYFRHCHAMFTPPDTYQ